MRIATEVLAAIDAAIEADGGASFRQCLATTVNDVADAYSTNNDRHRSHLGASIIGRECARDIWYTANWVTAPRFDARMIRLLNRGHLEEARFIALLQMIGCTVWQHDEAGKQFRISDADGYFGGSCDGVAVGVPGLNSTTPCLLEFKTANDKSWLKLVEEGVQLNKPEHYAQMQIYMHKLGLKHALYMSVNKNTDAIHAEFVVADYVTAEKNLEKARKIIQIQVAPQKISKDKTFWKCKFCNHRDVCHNGAEPDVNCRTCVYSERIGDGKWRCNKHWIELDTQQQLAACTDWKKDQRIYSL